MIVPAEHRRRTTTPHATMTTLASPTLGAASGALWLVEMPPGADGFSAPAATADALAAEVTRGDGTSAGVPPWVA